MTETFSLFDSLFWDITWQMTLCLAVGAVASSCLAKHAARSHRVLLLALAAALVAPAATAAVRGLGWGIFRARVEGTVAVADIAVVSPLVFPRDEAFAQPAVSRLTPPDEERKDAIGPEVFGAQRTAALEMPASGAEAVVAPTAPATPPGRSRTSVSSLSWYVLAVALWAILSAVATWRLARSVAGGLKLLSSSEPLSDERIAWALKLAARQLSIDARIGLYRSDQIRCPAIWGWGRNPRLLIPTDMAHGDHPIEWEAIICHELAHWKRRDHVTSLLAELACCLVPWQPFFWWTRSRLHQLSERACDDWALEAGHAADDYAESLLILVPQPRTALALAAVSSRRGLVGRIRHILDSRRTSPIVSRSWTAVATLIALLAVSAVAMAQQRAGVSDPSPAVKDAQETAAGEHADATDNDSQADQKSEDSTLEKHTLRGVVRNTAGEPIADAPVYLFGQKRRWDAAPRNYISGSSRRVAVMDGKTDSAGQFALTAQFDPSDYGGFWLVVAPRDYGSAASTWFRDLADAPGEFVKTVSEPLPIEGRILSPDGQPLPGAKISLRRVQGPLESEGWWSLSSSSYSRTSEPDFTFWPESVTTDADGRFRFTATGRDCLTTLRVEAEGYAPQELKVATSDAAAKYEAYVKAKGYQEATNFFDPNFTYALEPPRTAEGVFTDAESGEPIEGVEFEVRWTDYRGIIEGPLFATTDAKGHYRIHVPASDYYMMRAYPPTGYLAARGSASGRDIEKLLATAKVARYDFQLTRGTMVRGRIVDADSGNSISGVAVAYAPGKVNPNIQGTHDYDHRVLTDDDGRFAIATLPGKGVLVAEAPPGDYVRVTLPGPLFGSESDAYPHGFAEIDAPDADNWQGPEIILRKGPTLEVQAIAPDGKTAPTLWVASMETSASLTRAFLRSKQFKDGLFRMRGAEPERAYRAFFYAPEIDAGALAHLKYDASVESPQRLELLPAAKIRGRLVHPDGTPARDVALFPKFITTNENGEEIDLGDANGRNVAFYYNFAINAKQDRKTNENGEFELGGFVPDVYVAISINHRFENGKLAWPVGKLEAGEVRELGDLKLQQ